LHLAAAPGFLYVPAQHRPTMPSTEKPAGLIDRTRQWILAALAVALSLYTVWDVNYATLAPMSQLAMFAMIGTVLCFIIFPIHKRLKDVAWLKVLDFVLALLMVGCCGYLIFKGTDLTTRQGDFTAFEHALAVVGTLLIFEATRRSVGLALPILAGFFVLYALIGPSLPDWAFPHKGYDVNRIADTCFLGTSGVFGVAMRVMFTYVFLFVVFGVFLEMSGATRYIIDFARRLFGGFSGGPAMVSVAGSGLMGSLSGSAVANAATTGSFTIPMMTSAGFKPKDAGGVTAAAASGGALMPPVMGAGAYMMLEIIDPPVTFLEIVKAALIPALLFYLSLLLIVFFYSRRVGARGADDAEGEEKPRLLQYSGLVFFAALGTLILFLLLGRTPFRAVTWSLEVILILWIVSPKIDVSRATRVVALVVFGALTVGVAIVRAQDGKELSNWTNWADAAIPAMLITLLAGLTHRVWRPMLLETFKKAARSGIALVAASGCVGIIIGIVGMTGVGTEFPNAVVPLAEESLLAALIAIMICSIILGMGLPSAVCYLLMATLIGPVLSQLGVLPIAAHLFIFYFGMMSMVTPPVALAAYASASIAQSRIMPTAFASFFFALVGFTLPFMFVFRPELLLATDKPDLTVKSANINPEDDGKVETEIELLFVEQPVTNSKVSIRGANENAAQTLRTDDDGLVNLNLAAGRWQISVTRKRRDRLKNLKPLKPIVIEKDHWLEGRDGGLLATEFDDLDKNQDRRVSLAELLARMTKQAADAAHLFEVWDEDDDTALSKEEFDKGPRALGDLQSLDANSDGAVDLDEMVGDLAGDAFIAARNLFERWDTDEDDTLSAEEFGSGPKRLGGPFADFDSDGDQGLSPDELILVLVGEKWHPVSKSFADWDTNSDGRLSRKEFDARPGPLRAEFDEESIYDVRDGYQVMHLGALSVDPTRSDAAAESENDAAAETLVTFDDRRLTFRSVALAVGAAVLGIVALAVCIAGYFLTNLSLVSRTLMFVAAALLLLPAIEIGHRDVGPYVNLAGAILFAAMAVFNGVFEKRRQPATES